MYYFVVAAFMLVLPVGSIAAESLVAGASVNVLLVAKWFAFWSVGWRLLLAGLRQIIQPQYTAREILGIKGDDSLLLVRELGFANVAVGIFGVASLFQPTWRLGAALVGGVFYALAGVNHLSQHHRTRLEQVAMVSDLFAAVVLLVCCTFGLMSN